MTQPTPITCRNFLHLSGLLEQTAAMVAKKSTLLNALNFLQQYGEIPVFCVSAHKGLDVTTDKVFKTGLQAVWNNLNHFGADQSPPPTKAHRFQ
jgi:hypothetical protein